MDRTLSASRHPRSVKKSSGCSGSFGSCGFFGKITTSRTRTGVTSPQPRQRGRAAAVPDSPPTSTAAPPHPPSPQSSPAPGSDRSPPWPGIHAARHQRAPAYPPAARHNKFHSPARRNSQMRQPKSIGSPPASFDASARHPAPQLPAACGLRPEHTCQIQIGDRRSVQHPPQLPLARLHRDHRRRIVRIRHRHKINR